MSLEQQPTKGKGVVENDDGIEDDHGASGRNHEPAECLDLIRLVDNPVEEENRDAEQVEEALVHKVLGVDELALPLFFVRDEDQHDEARCKQ